uniref:Uncharacterized protein n=1 Tax=Rhipicephalus appendiculatus TaxID=34631 RepID=A0A131YVZ9_RHIAP
MISTINALHTSEPATCIKYFTLILKFSSPIICKPAPRNRHYQDESTQFSGFMKSASCVQPKSQKLVSKSLDDNSLIVVYVHHLQLTANDRADASIS